MDDFDVKMEGEEALIKVLQAIEKKMATTVVRKGTRVGAKVFQKQIQSNILSMLSGSRHVAFKGGKTKAGATKAAVKGRLMDTMRRALKVRKVKTKQPKGVYKMKTEFDAGAKDLVYIAKGRGGADPNFMGPVMGNRSYIPSAIEYGHKIVGWGGRVSKKRAAPIPFYRKAFDTEAHTAKDKTIITMWNELDKIATSLGPGV